MGKKKETGIAKFKSLEDEKEYWEAHGPLAEGHKGRINKPRFGLKRSSFLVVRLTGEELSRLRDIAAKRGIGPSTFARLVLTSIIENQGKMLKQITVDELKDIFEKSITPSEREKAEVLIKSISIPDIDNPALLLIDASQIKEFEKLVVSWLRAFLAVAGLQVISSEDERYKKVKEITGTRTLKVNK